MLRSGFVATDRAREEATSIVLAIRVLDALFLLTEAFLESALVAHQDVTNGAASTAGGGHWLARIPTLKRLNVRMCRERFVVTFY